MKISNTGPSADPWGTPQCPSDSQPLITPFWMWLSNLTHLTVYAPNPSPLNLERRILWGTMSKTLQKSRQMTSAALPLILWLSYYITESHTLVSQDFPLVKPCWVCLFLPVHQQGYTSFEPPFLINEPVQAHPVILCVPCQVQFQFCQLCSTTLFPKIPQTISLNSWKSVSLKFKNLILLLTWPAFLKTASSDVTN